MPVRDGEFEPLTAEQIRELLEVELEAEFGEDVDLSQFSVFSTLVETIATVDSEEVEQGLVDVYESAFLDTAEDESLEKVVALLGFSRRDAVPATGYERFTSDDPVNTDYVIPSGTDLETDGSNPARFETTESTTLQYYDGFEDNDITEYTGDTGSFTTQSTTVHSGTYALEATAGGTIIAGGGTATSRGMEVSAQVQIGTGGNGGFVVAAQDTSNCYRVRINESTDALVIEYVDGGAVSNSSSISATINTGEWYDLRVRLGVQDDVEARVIDSSGTELASTSISDGNYDSGQFGAYAAAAPVYVDEISNTFVSANIEAVVGGAEGNVGSDSITVLPSVPNGVDTITNPVPTGNRDYVDTDGTVLVTGEDEETDPELRERVRDTVTGGGGSATVNAIRSTLVNDTESVSSVRVFENDTGTDNTGSGGLPPYSFETVVLGGTDADVAEAIFDTKAVTARDYGGAHGTAVTETVTAENGQSFDINFSRPTAVDIDFTIDVEAYDTYVGDTEIRNRIVDYIGGTRSDETTLVGTEVGEDVFISQVEDIIVGPDDTGVRSVTSISSTPSITTNANGADVVSIGSSEVAETNASDGSIVINVTTVSQ